MFVGKNPWHSHGFPRSRVVLKQIAKDPDRSLIVIDPRRTKTAAPGGLPPPGPARDGRVLPGRAAGRAGPGGAARRAVPGGARARRRGAVQRARARSRWPTYCRRAGVEESLVRAVARRLAGASSVSILEDLGIQQAPHSTLNSYLEKLLFLLTGNFGKPGGMNLHTGIGKLGGDFSRDTATPVSGERIIIGLVPGNAIPDEILTDDPNRLRAMIVESSNPAHSLADSQRMRAALEQLDLVVVLDIAMTETARLADYVLPSPSQFEKWEASFFCLEFPSNAFQLRRPVMPAPRRPAERGRDPFAPRPRCRRIGGHRPRRPERRGGAQPGRLRGDAVRSRGRAAGAAPPAARDRPRDARSHAAGRSCRRVGAVAAGPWSRPDDARLGSPRRLRGRRTRARRGAVRGDPVAGIGPRVHARRVRGDLEPRREHRPAA